MDLSFFIHNSQIHQKWNRSSFLQYILFHTIVCQNLNRLFRLMLFHFDSYFTLFADKNTAIFASSLHLQLGKSTLLKTLFHICDHFFSAVIGVKDLGSHRGGCLITDAAFQFYLADPHLGRSLFFLAPLAA